ncbi:MAG: hypothetical protein HY657_11015 [Acidobacteria bacterium]|nr:hypothetical protein [Acidobacteriota bacterium]
MTWKSYAAVSGATVLAGWLASAPPSIGPASAPAQAEPPEAVPPSALDVEQQAARLQAGLRQQAAYREPDRNPFRFAVRPEARNTPDASRAPAAVEAVAPLPPPPPISLSGIAEDRVGDRVERTAVLSSPSGVLLVREGDEVMGRYRVVKIESEAVDLAPLADGVSLRLAFRP